MRELPAKIVNKYRKFHDDLPDHVEDKKSAWIPGKVEIVGPAVDIGYVRATDNTSKKSRFVHTFKDNVVCLERNPRSGQNILEIPEYPFAVFPQRLLVLGYCLGFTVNDEEIVAPVSWKLCTDFNTGRILVVVDKKGVRNVFCGGRMYVKDWIYN